VLPLTEGVRAYYLERLGEEPPCAYPCAGENACCNRSGSPRYRVILRVLSAVEGFVLNVEVAESSREEGKLRGRRPRGPMDRMGSLCTLDTVCRLLACTGARLALITAILECVDLPLVA
jgi:hypothetical protein